ncbi:hypothetical protein ND856_14025 [Leptospira bandrabouensis]|uniref:hypothetical protein n=1 Tax=Leptospira bandrabouensis TaxID=2484903 RepID=UPI00223DFA88|nr:hypothetical protein [Leptospira bandrabouensis]MCW7459574.1 hypothetical protein [Leptospira bandrabouensis]MCW7478408.1 hypothetical protein [Leptospira bandrabouensis]MCW7486309.1 hypothetical protein [Leptospira bandrabouensis]
MSNHSTDLLSPSLRDEKLPQDFSPCAHGETVSLLLKKGLSASSLSDEFRCHRTKDTYQYGLCKTCAQIRTKSVIPTIDEVRR